VIGIIQFGRVNGAAGLRGMTPSGELLGYAARLDEACDSMWEWCHEK